MNLHPNDLYAFDTLDFAADWAFIKSVTFENGVENVVVEAEQDFSSIVTQNILVGTPNTLVSVKADATALANSGLVEAVASASELKSQGSLDLANQVALDTYKTPIERITVKGKDATYPAAAFDVFDLVTVIDVNSGINGLKQIATIERDMTQGGIVTLGFTDDERDPVANYFHVLSELGFKNLQTGGMQSKYITYSGDGAESHLIDVGFSPKIIMLGGLSMPDLPQPNSNMPKLPLGQSYLIIFYDLATDTCNILVGTSYYAEIYSVMPQTIAGFINGTQVDVGILAAISGFEWLNSNGLSFFLQAFG